MASPPYMPLWVADYLADTSHLTPAQHGAYLLLIMNYWQRGGPLPDDDLRLARIARMTRRDWLHNRGVILDFFTKQESLLVHPRIESELSRASAKSLKNSAAGRTSAERRFGARSTHVQPLDPDKIRGEKKGSDKSEPTKDQPGADRDCDDLSGEPPSGGEHQDENELGEHYTAPFEKWWSEYPNKTGKRKASLAYSEAFKRLGGRTAGVDRVHGFLLSAVAAQATVWRRKGIVGKFIPHPTTWLTQSRWEDGDVKAELDRVRGVVGTAGNGAPAGGLVDVHLQPPTPPPPEARREKLTADKVVGWTP